MVHNPSLKQLGTLIASLRKDPDSHLLVAGGKPALFSDDIRNLPRVTFWHSTEQSARQNAATVPTRTGAIVFNRWVDHALTANLRREAKRLDIPMCNIPLGPSTILDLIKEAGLMGDEDETTAVLSDAPVAMGRGRLRAFILQEGDLRAPVGTEIPRLFALAQERGLPTTMASISTTFYQVRANKIGIVRVRRMPEGDIRPVAIEEFPETEPPVEPFLKPADDIDAPNLFATIVEINREVRHAQDDLKVLKDTPPVEATPPPVFGTIDEAMLPPISVLTAKPPHAMEPRQVLALIDDAIVNLQKLTGDAVSALQLVYEAIEGIEPALAESAKLQAKIDKMKAFLND